MKKESPLIFSSFFISFTFNDSIMNLHKQHAFFPTFIFYIFTDLDCIHPHVLLDHFWKGKQNPEWISSLFDFELKREKTLWDNL